jgi:lyso-ornithine lipid O-acyltransferase
VTLGAALAICFAHYWLIRMRGRPSLERRAVWLQASCRRVMTAMGIHCRAEGAAPSRGLLVSNHLSHIDILVYGSMMPCFFISKSEVAFWPFFGWAARAGGTLFLDRKRRISANMVAQAMSARLKLTVPIFLFPEGTSTDGSGVLRFHPRLYEPAIVAQSPVTAAAIRYVNKGGSERELCWFGDMSFVPHIWRVLGANGFLAEVQFAQARTYPSRRDAAQSTYDEVVAMRSALLARTWDEANEHAKQLFPAG